MRTPIPAYTRAKVIKRDLYICQACGLNTMDDQIEIHHIKPVVYGGTNDIDNLISLCNTCHKNAPDDKKEFEEYIINGGFVIPHLIGMTIQIAEKNKLDILNMYHKGKEIINGLQVFNIKSQIRKHSKYNHNNIQFIVNELRKEK